MKEIYKGFLIYNKKFYIELLEIDNTKEYYFKNGYLIENKESNRTAFHCDQHDHESDVIGINQTAQRLQ